MTTPGETAGRANHAVRRLAARALALFVAVSLSCTAEQPERPQETQSSTFLEELEESCLDVESELTMTVSDPDTAGTAESFERAVNVQEAFSRRVRSLDPPPQLDRAYTAYVDALDDVIDANGRVITAAPDTETLLRLKLRGAEAGLRAWRAKMDGQLPAPCPPLSGLEAASYVFAAGANLRCHDLGGELESVAPAGNPPTRRETLRLIELVRDLLSRIVSILRHASTSLVEDAPAIVRVIDSYQDRVRLVSSVQDALASGNRREYQRKGRSLLAATRRSERVAASMGLFECIRVVQTD